MLTRARTFLAVEMMAFLAAALLHSTVPAYAHWKAATAETVIAVALGAGLLVSMLTPATTRTAALAAQAFALLGTCVGLFTISIGVGPQTALDLAIHAGFVTMLVIGLVRVWQRGAAVAV